MAVLPKVLFLCTGNSCRSQMAEGWARELLAEKVEPYSAGIETHGLNRSAVQVMAEAGVDISHQTSKTLDSLSGIHFDLVITLCGHAHENCPVFPGETRVIHAGFDDPARESGLFHQVRDEIRAFICTVPEYLGPG